jgi:hypothetical protein
VKAPIPWLRVFVEGVVIVGSILLAFGIDAAWEGRQEDAEAVEMLLGLQSAFEGHRDVFERHLGNYEQRNLSTTMGHVGRLIREQYPV